MQSGPVHSEQKPVEFKHVSLLVDEAHWQVDFRIILCCHLSGAKETETTRQVWSLDYIKYTFST